MRKPFAAKRAHGGWGWTLLIVGVFAIFCAPDYRSSSSDVAVAATALVVVAGIILGLWGIYLLRGDDTES